MVLDGPVVSFYLGNMIRRIGIIHVNIELGFDSVHHATVFVVAIDDLHDESCCIALAQNDIQCLVVILVCLGIDRHQASELNRSAPSF